MGGPLKRSAGVGGYFTELLNRRWLSQKTFEVELAKPRSFEFLPGQRIRLAHEGIKRDYSLISTPQDQTLALCIRKVDGGVLSAFLAAAEIGSEMHFTGPHGYFIFRGSMRPAVLVATGVGISPFVSMTRSGVTCSTLLHGVRTAAELYYEPLLRNAAKRYVPCLSKAADETGLPHDSFRGRVTEYVKKHLEPGIYDFYVCGRSEMVRDVTLLADELFPGSHVYVEVFY